MKKILVGSGIVSLLFSCTANKPGQPNVLFIALDDQNDWMGAFGGNPQVLTPNIDRLCNTNAMTFQNAHCPAPVSCPSRTAILSGFRPETTGVYGNTQNMLGSVLIQKHATMPEYFSKNGYITISKGKIFHRHPSDQGEWAFDVWELVEGSNRPQRDKLTSRNDEVINGVKEENPKYSNKGETPFPWHLGDQGFAWAPTIEKKEETTDYKTARWFAEQLKRDYDKPFFMAAGFAKPHDPFYVPQEYFDMYKLEDIIIPEFRLDDLDDVLTPSGEKKFRPSNDFLWVRQDEELFKGAVRAYMATISYVDDCVGVILDALSRSKYSDNTIVIIWGDNGWHMGEKLKFAKNTAWSESTRIPLIIQTPEMKEKLECRRVVNLIDLYPTLIELCGLPGRDSLAGRSLVPLLRDPDIEWPYPSLTTLTDGSFTVIDENWRYSKYTDGTEELYDLKNDPMEWTNLISSDKMEAREAKARLEKLIPEYSAPGVPHNKVLASDVKPRQDEISFYRSFEFRPLYELK